MIESQQIVKNHYREPVFSLSNKLKRMIWNISWVLFCKYTPVPLHRWRVFITRLFGGKIGRHNSIYPSASIWAPWMLETEEHACIGPGVEIYNPGGVFIGHHTIISQNAYICGASHDYNSSNFTYFMSAITLMPYVWICARAIVLPGVICSAGSVLAAGAITSKNLDSWTVYGGNPARKIKVRDNFTNSKF